MKDPVMIVGMDLARPDTDMTVILGGRQGGKGLTMAIVRESMRKMRETCEVITVDVPMQRVPMMPEETEEWIPSNRKGRRHQAAKQRRRS